VPEAHWSVAEVDAVCGWSVRTGAEGALLTTENVFAAHEEQHRLLHVLACQV
jgi:hypothetical protein